MRSRIASLRWRLARRIAPVPIMADPCEGREAFVVQRSKPGVTPAWQVSVPLDKLNIDISTALPSFRDEAEPFAIRSSRRHVTVTGSAES